MQLGSIPTVVVGTGPGFVTFFCSEREGHGSTRAVPVLFRKGFRR